MRTSLSQASLMACIGLSIRVPATLHMKSLSLGGMSSCIFFPTGTILRLILSASGSVSFTSRAARDSSIACLKCFPSSSSSETECSLIVTASMSKAPVCTHGQGCPFLSIGGHTEIASSTSSISLTFSLMSDSSHGFHVLGSQEELVSKL